MIEVRQLEGMDPLEFEVTVRQGKGETHHRVTMARGSHAHLAAATSPSDLIRAAFEFLLEREPKESILTSFDVEVIGRYFPEFESEIATYLGDSRRSGG